MEHFRDDKVIGEKLNKYFGRSNIDYTEWECWKTGSLLWALHSYLEYEYGLLNMFQVELTVLNENLKDGGQMTRNVIRTVYREIFRNSRYHKVTALISPENKQATKFQRVAGFTHEGTLRKVDKGKDIAIFSIFEEEYKRKWERSLVNQLPHQQRPIQQIQSQLKPEPHRLANSHLAGTYSLDH